MALLDVEEIDVFYGSIQALRGVTLKVDAGERVALLGANGAGKTTTLRTVSGLLSPKKGKVLFKDEEIGGLPAYKVVGKGVAHGPEGRALFPTLSVEENLRFGYLPRLKAQDGAYKNPLRRAGAAAKRFLGAADKAYGEQLDYVFHYFPRLKERRKQAAGTLSGGEQQMLVMARALMSSPKLLIDGRAVARPCPQGGRHPLRDHPGSQLRGHGCAHSRAVRASGIGEHHPRLRPC